MSTVVSVKTRSCPRCRERVALRASVCPHCRSYIGGFLGAYAGLGFSNGGCLLVMGLLSLLAVSSLFVLAL